VSHRSRWIRTPGCGHGATWRTAATACAASSSNSHPTTSAKPPFEGWPSAPRGAPSVIRPRMPGRAPSPHALRCIVCAPPARRDSPVGGRSRPRRDGWILREGAVVADPGGLPLWNVGSGLRGGREPPERDRPSRSTPAVSDDSNRAVHGCCSVEEQLSEPRSPSPAPRRCSNNARLCARGCSCADGGERARPPTRTPRWLQRVCAAAERQLR
jgi:hypothetical protein